MKIAVLADIHGNLAALHAVIDDLDGWSPDIVVVAGDMVNRGPQSQECLDLTLHMAAERGWRVIRGNHERYMLQYAQDRLRPDFPRSGPRHAVSLIVAWAYGQVVDRLHLIAALPERLNIDLDGELLAVYHASARHDRDGITRHSADAELREQIDPTATIFCVGHTHAPLIRRLDRTLVVNVGAVGLPFDGDTRAAYARLTRGRRGTWEAKIVRVPYDVATTTRVFRESGMQAGVGPQGQIMLRELETGDSLMYDFIPAYYERILAGELSVADAVRAFLAAVDGGG